MADGAVHPFAELVTIPLTFTMVIGAKLPHLTYCEITNFADFPCDQKVAGEIQIPIGFCHTDIPGDFRTRAQIEADRAGGGAVQDAIAGFELRNGLWIPRDFGQVLPALPPT